MKGFIIGTALTLTIPLGMALLDSSFSSAAYAQVDQDNVTVCSIPPTAPTGGGTTERMQAIQRCKPVQSMEQQKLSSPPMAQPNPSSLIPSSILQNQALNGNVNRSYTGGCQIPSPEPTGGAYMERMQAIQRCNEVR